MRKSLVVGAVVAVGAMLAGGVAYAAGSQPARSGYAVEARTINATPLAAIDSTSETKFTSIAPCRAVDTRSAGGALASGQGRQFRVGGSSSFASQGGPSSGCGLPTNPVAVAVTITTIARSGGYLKAWAAQAPEPATSFMNYGTAFNASTSGNVPSSSAGTITIRNFTGTTNVIVDITGYYVKPLAAQINTNGSIARQSRVTSATKGVTGQYTVNFDRAVSACYYSTAPFFDGYTVRAEPRGTNGVEIFVDNASGQHADAPFYLVVTC